MRCGSCTCNWARPATPEAERLTEMKRLLHKAAGYVDQTPGRDGITGLQHALRCAALAQQHPAHPDAPFIGLVHDLARPLNDVHHGEIIAEIVRDRVTDTAYKVLQTHGQFQAAIVHHTNYPDAPGAWRNVAMQLAAIEVRSFATDYTGPELTIGQAEQLLTQYLA